MILKNDVLTIKIDNFGAEVKSIIKNDIEYLWQGNPFYWKRTSPVLFPIIGKLVDNEYIFEDQTYQMAQHGFARDNEFVLVNSSKHKATYLLKENKSTLVQYPFKFNLYISYEINKNQLIVSWRVENTTDYTLYFQIGAHPAFNFLNGSILKINKKLNLYMLEGTPHISKVLENVNVGSITIDDKTFLDDALIFEGLDEITLKDDHKSVTIKSEDFPYFGVWTNVKDGKNSPFICLEPWHGIADFIDHDKQFIDKKGIIALQRNKTFQTSYTIVIN